MTVDVAIPGGPHLELRHAVLDLNGTLTVDGLLLEGVEPRVTRLRDALALHLATSDTMGTAASIAARLGCELVRVGPPHEADVKADLVRSLGPRATAAIGNGANDAEMLATAAVGICVVGAEGAAQSTLAAADIVVTDPLRALDLLLDPLRLACTLRR